MSEDNIFREVDEDLRTEQYQKLWNRYGRLLIGAAVGVVVVTAVWQGYTAWETRRAEAFGERFVAALQLLQRGQAGAAITALEVLEREASKGYAAMARLQRAAALIVAGDRREAIALYDQVANDADVDATLRDLAALMAAQNLVDTADRATLERRLTPLAADDNAWRYEARELLALAALKAGDHQRARELLTALTDDPATPQGLRARAAELLAALAA